MTRDDFKSLLTKATNPDTLAEALAGIEAGVSDLYAETDTLKSTLETQTEQISQLRDSNMRLFLRTSENIETSEKEETENKITLDDIVKSMKEGIKNL